MNGGGGISSGGVVVGGSGGAKRRGASRVRMVAGRGCVGSMTGFVFFAKPRVAAEARRDILWVA